jgi:glycoprotein endo-alpha-1,2-mannosidase
MNRVLHKRSLALGLALMGLVAAATPVAGGGAASPRRVAIFFYPWYGTPQVDGEWRHWQQRGASPPLLVASNYYPARGAYSSADSRVVRAQMAEIASARVDEVVTSWWGRGSAEDGRLALVTRLARARGLDVSVHLEPYGKRTAASAADDLRYLQSLGIRSAYVYDAEQIPAVEWAAALAPLQSLRLFAHTRLVGWAKRAGFDGVYTYTNAEPDDFARLCKQARVARLLCSPSVSPGFDARRAVGTKAVRPRRGGRTYDAQWRAAICASPNLVTIASYNEWHEGTQIEPASSAPPGRRGTYRTYAGAYRLKAKPAERAYLARTAYWAKRYRAGSSCPR